MTKSSSLTILLLLALVSAGCLLGAGSVGAIGLSKHKGGRVSAHLTRTKFSDARAGGVKLIYSFPSPSKTFGYLIQVKKGARWKKVVGVTWHWNFSQSSFLTVRRLFNEKHIATGSYRLTVSADTNSKQFAFTVVPGMKSGNALAISAGADYTCALLKNHRIKCWGGNSYGQLRERHDQEQFEACLR